MTACRLKAAALGILLATAFETVPARAQAEFDAQRIVDDFEAAQPSDDFKQQRELMDGVLPADRFDVDRYFSVLDALKPAEGYALDWVYCNRGSGGYPVLYARAADAAPIADFVAYAAQATNDLPANADARDFLRYGYLEKIQAEDSPKGFFQLAVLRLLGDRFQLYWHEYYNEIHLVCSRDGWEKRLARERERGKPYEAPPKAFAAAAKKLDFAPRIRMADDRVDVGVVAYRPFGGLVRYDFTFSRTYPHRLLKQSRTVLREHKQRFAF
ncbi:MAG: hypothetical protein AB7V14_10050 [Kiritimatiellia bacterium]